MSRAAGGPKTAERSDFASLAERANWLNGLRVATAAAVVGVAAAAPQIRTESLSTIAVASGAYLAVSLAPSALIRSRRWLALVAIGATLLVDGAYLAWVMYSTGGILSPLRFLVLAHIGAVTLAGSYRTGFKVAAWHSQLLFVTSYAQEAGFIEVRETAVAALPGDEHFWSLAMLVVGSNLAVAVATAVFSSINERELRAQKIDLDELSSMVRRIDASADASVISRVLLDDLARVFGFTRGAVFGSSTGELTLLASRDANEETTETPSEDEVVTRTLDGGNVVLVGALDPDENPTLASFFPGARNVAIVPMYLAGELPLGIVVLEHAGGSRIKRWVVRLVEQYVSHAALALRNTWLFHELQAELTENEVLRGKLVAYNETLEGEVQERTRELNESLSDLRVAADEKRRLLARLVDAQEEERLRVAHDIHDAPLQNMAATSMRLQLLRNQTKDAEYAASLDKLTDTVRATMKSMRRMIFELRPTILDEEGVGGAIVEYLETAGDGPAFDVVNRLEREPPQELRVILYRITQEALANVRKHAQASKVSVVLEERDGGYLVTVEDDGIGFAPPEVLRSAPGHLGLSAMRERAEMVGGRCSVRSTPGSGTFVEFWLPATDVPAPSERLDGIDSVEVIEPTQAGALDSSSIPDRQPENV
jgi:signal transduction histidine kinase